MASKGQKFNKYTKEFKNEILDKYYSGIGGFTSLSNEYNVPIKTIKTWVYKINHPQVKIEKKRGRPRKDEIIDYKERYEILKKYQAFIEARHKTK